MRNHIQYRDSRKLAQTQPIAPELPKRRNRLALLAVLTTIFLSLTLSGCTGLTGAGTPAANQSTNTSTGSLAANATSFSFGNVATGSSTSQSLTLTNTGTAAVTISQGTITGTGFTVVGGITTMSIPAGQSHTFQIQFVPQTTGAAAGSLTIATGGSTAPLAISLSGTGTTPLAITMPPSNQSVLAGQTATFSVAATGTGTVTYQWKKNGVAISGATYASYTTPATAASDNAAQFTVAVSDSSGGAVSATATLSVTSAPVAPSITTQPASKSVNVGQTATFTVAAAGTATLTYQWSKNGSAISGATSASYTTPATTISDNGALFMATVSNSAGSIITNTATLTVTVPPAITTQPSSQAVNAGQTATFTVAASGAPTLSYQWLKNGAAISGATSTSYTTPATVGSDNGALFTVTVTNASGNVTSNAATLTVNVPPSITAQPANQTVNVGQTATFAVTATGTATLTYQWKKNGAAISGATSASYTTPATASSDSGASFTVTVTNGFGNVTSNAATLTVNIPPTITAQPGNQTVAVGQTATFTVAATGSGTLTYQWKKNGTAVSGATSASYTTPATAGSDNGASFTVTITGNSGNITSNAATLTVNAPPSIASQPTSQTVNAGQTATFAVTASGTATLTYQWSKNGSAIGGATSASYTTPATASADNGAQFTVTVSNAAGNVTSSSATLTVNTGTFILNASTSSLSFSSVTIGSNSILGVTFTNAGNANVTIAGVSISGAGYNASGVSSGQILTPGQTATLNVTFTPASAGSLPGSATVTSNATNSPSTISFTGTGVQPVSHAVTLNWGASTSTVSGYNIYRSTVSGGPYTKQNSSLISTTSYTDSSVQAGQTYFYVVTSVDSTGTESTFSNEVSATIPTP